ncbi:hypothetical protein CRG98_048086 [Punica granatum]|uniref:Uncharacterized protein n=1 Tax=Punica granatum TaxID=22663 RepID=A0A2I0HII7_PUNGR|nr:hypothetical protein CRG98_048086 [Punica granatum]
MCLPPHQSTAEADYTVLFQLAAIKLCLQFGWNIENQLLRLAGWRMRNIVTAFPLPLTSLSISEIVELFKSLPSLQTLNISECPRLKALSGRAILRYMPMTPNLQSTNPRKLVLDYIPKLETLPWWIQHLTNLERLIILSWQNLKALPEWFPNLTSLQSPTIWNCGEELTRRCQEDTGGEDWPKISHIQQLQVGKW